MCSAAWTIRRETQILIKFDRREIGCQDREDGYWVGRHAERMDLIEGVGKGRDVDLSVTERI